MKLINKMLILFIAALTLLFLQGLINTAKAEHSNTLDVEYGAVGLGVTNHEIVGAANSFSSSAEKLYCLTSIIGAQKAIEITHIWYYNNAERARITLAVKSPRWRTFSSKIILPHEIGHWQIVVVDPEGNILDSFPFEIVKD